MSQKRFLLNDSICFITIYRNSFRFWQVDKNCKMQFNLEMSCKTNLILEIETPVFFPSFYFLLFKGTSGVFPKLNHIFKWFYIIYRIKHHTVNLLNNSSTYRENWIKKENSTHQTPIYIHRSISYTQIMTKGIYSLWTNCCNFVTTNYFTAQVKAFSPTLPENAFRYIGVGSCKLQPRDFRGEEGVH